MPLFSEKEIFLAIPASEEQRTVCKIWDNENIKSFQYNDCRAVLQSENTRIAEKFTNEPIKIERKIMRQASGERHKKMYFKWLQRQH